MIHEQDINRRVLVVDDNRNIHEDFRQILSVSAHGAASDISQTNATLFGDALSAASLPSFKVECVDDGVAGLNAIQQALDAEQPYAVAFIDMRLGEGWSGSETIAKMWNVDSSLQCVLCTAYTDIPWEQVLGELSHSDRLLILRKPFEAIEVQQIALSLTHKWTLGQHTQSDLDGLSSVAMARTIQLQEANARLLQDIERRRQTGERYAKTAEDLERKNAELATAKDELSASKSHMENIIGSMADMLLVIDANMAISAVNHALLSLLGFEEKELLHESPSKIFGEELAQGSIIETLYCQGSVSNVETSYLAKNGQTIPISLSGSLMKDEKGAIQGLVCVAQDITERKRIEEERRQLHDQVVETSRRLGMADVATSVLHNVGNVLNSINVSVGIMSSTLRQSLVGDVQKISTMLNMHIDDLGTYMTEDVKGKQIPGYLSQLAEHLLQEQAVALKELVSLTGSADHAKECVAMQQGMVKAGGLQEPIVLADLVEQALSINKTLLEQVMVSLIREYQDIPEVVVDKHQALQIVVNLVRNAVQAMQTAEEKILTVRIGVSPEDRNMVHLEIVDTGVGIHPDHLTRIFSQGFTTKKEGHGFGLHSGALLAKNMGGTLNVWSQGLGCGATLILTLPIGSTDNLHASPSSNSSPSSTMP
ncbi:MAG: ATP-binding protein [Nitrospirales bacterium]